MASMMCGKRGVDDEADPMGSASKRIKQQLQAGFLQYGAEWANQAWAGKSTCEEFGFPAQNMRKKGTKRQGLASNWPPTMQATSCF
jgi:hypothetical protein